MSADPKDKTATLKGGPETSSTGGKVVPLRGSATDLAGRADDELMQLAAAGVDDAFAAIVRRYQGQVRTYCARRCGGASLGDDVAQEVFVQLWRTRARYEPRGRFRPFLYTIVQTRLLNAIQRRRPEEELKPEMPSSTDEMDAILRAEQVRRIHGRLSALPGQLREALLLRFSAGLHYDEIAEVIKRPAGTARSRVFHGIMRLRQLLGEDKNP